MRKKPSPKTEIDTTDQQIMTLLQQNSKQSYRAIAKKIGTSGATTAARIKSLEKKGIICGYSTSIDYAKLGYDLTAVIFLQVEGIFLDSLKTNLSKSMNVVALYEVTGDFDLAALVKVEGRDSLNLLIKDLLAISHVRKTMTSICLSVAKEDFSLKF